MEHRTPRHLTCRYFAWILLGLMTAGLLAFQPATAAAAQVRKPNIIFIMADDLGYGHLGCYGQKQIRTPHIDRLAADGLRFTQVYAGAPVCAPSRSTLMTGLHTGHTPVRANPGGIPLRPEDVTVAEVLRTAGYATGLFGKWGLGDAGTTGVPTRQGFDEAFGYLHQVHAHFFYPEYLWKNEQKFPLAGNRNGQRGQYSHDVIVEQALGFVRRHRERPFFLYLPFTIPHLELIVPDEALKEYQGRFEEVPFDDRRPGYADAAAPKATLAAMISRMDRGVGRLMSLLKELGIDEQTVVFFTSDNGAQGGAGTNPEFFRASGPLRGYKGSMYEGGLRVPMIARWPGRIRPGTVSDQVWAFWDVLPTLAEIAGAPPPAGIDGISMLPALLGRPQARRHEYLYWELPSRAGLAQGMRMGDWKAVRPQPDASLELFNLKTDPGEQENVAARYPEVVAKIEATLKLARTEPRLQIEPPKEPGKRYQ